MYEFGFDLALNVREQVDLNGVEADYAAGYREGLGILQALGILS